MTSGELESRPRCEAQQLALALKRLGGSPFVELRHVRGRPCRVSRMRIDLRVYARDGEPVALLSFNGSGRFSGDIAPDTSFLAAFVFLPKCGQGGPFLAVVAAGPYTAKRRLPHPRACQTH